MRLRLTVAMLLLVAVTLIVTTISSYFLIHHASVASAQQELAAQAQASSEAILSGPRVTKASFERELKIITDAGSFASIQVLRLYPDGTIEGSVPNGVTLAELNVPRLRNGLQTTGHTSSQLVYSAVPTPITRFRDYVPVLVMTRQARDPANGFRYFFGVGAIGLVVAALVAAGLARRFTRPLVAAATATHRIASGDLDATVPVHPHEIPEFAQLAESINTMGTNLVRARDQERQFLLSVSHELRTPLTSIRGYADAIVDGATDDTTAAATVISGEARRLERLVQDLLDLARLDADRFSLKVEPTDCAEVVRQVAAGFRPRATELGLELLTEPDSDEPLWVAADSDRLGQVVANLVENAASFADHRIVVGAGSVSGVATIWVVDDGPGIPTDQLSKVFGRHFISDRVSGRRKGAGLGLAIVSELAAAMGAGVRAESPVAEGRGTRMVVWFRPEGTAAPAWPGPAIEQRPALPGQASADPGPGPAIPLDPAPPPMITAAALLSPPGGDTPRGDSPSPTVPGATPDSDTVTPEAPEATPVTKATE
jgi:two-component system, OmpR family, sensor kinase